MIESKQDPFIALGHDIFRHLMTFLNNKEIATFARTCIKANQIARAHYLYKRLRTMPLRDYTAEHTLSKTHIKVPIDEADQKTVYQFNNGNTLICGADGIMRLETGSRKTRFKQATHQGVVKRIYALNETTFATTTHLNKVHFWSMAKPKQFTLLSEFNHSCLGNLTSILVREDNIAICAFIRSTFVLVYLKNGQLKTFASQDTPESKVSLNNVVQLNYDHSSPYVSLHSVELTRENQKEYGSYYNTISTSLCTDGALYIQAMGHNVARDKIEIPCLKLMFESLQVKVEQITTPENQATLNFDITDSICMNSFDKTLYLSIPESRSAMILQASNMEKGVVKTITPPSKRDMVSKKMMTQNGNICFFMNSPLNKNTVVLHIAEFPESEKNNSL